MRVHADRREDLLRDCIRNTGDPGRLTKKIAPSDNPRPERCVFWWNHVLGNEIHPPRRRVGRNQLSDWVGESLCVGTHFHDLPDIDMH